jgi:hypothetical protein
MPYMNSVCVVCANTSGDTRDATNSEVNKLLCVCVCVCVCVCPSRWKPSLVIALLLRSKKEDIIIDEY